MKDFGRKVVAVFGAITIYGGWVHHLDRWVNPVAHPVWNFIEHQAFLFAILLCAWTFVHTHDLVPRRAQVESSTERADA